MKKFSDAYLDILNNELKGLNLTRILDPQEFYEKQVLDSLYPFEKMPELESVVDNTNLLLDVGFGGGFPSIPLAKKYPHINVAGIEARGKKATAVNLIAERLGLSNAQFFHQRLEKLLIDLPTLITFKAVGKINQFLEMINFNQECYVLFYKGKNLSELEPNYKNNKNWELVRELDFSEHGYERTILLFKSCSYPTVKDKNLVKLSEILSN